MAHECARTTFYPRSAIMADTRAEELAARAEDEGAEAVGGEAGERARSLVPVSSCAHTARFHTPAGLPAPRSTCLHVLVRAPRLPAVCGGRTHPQTAALQRGEAICSACVCGRA